MTYVWPASRDAMASEQRRISELSPEPWTSVPTTTRFGGCYATFLRGTRGGGRAGDPVWAAAVLMSSAELAGSAIVRDRTDDAYAAGFLALREGRALARAVEDLPDRPHVLLVNATGRDHPRGAGLALHLGAVLDVPTVGVTHRPLIAVGALPLDRSGAVSPLRLGDRTVGFWLRTKRGTRPLAIHAAWRTEPDIAVQAVLPTVGPRRTPEPLREARRLARTERAGSATA